MYGIFAYIDPSNHPNVAYIYMVYMECLGFDMDVSGCALHGWELKFRGPLLQRNRSQEAPWKRFPFGMAEHLLFVEQVFPKAILTLPLALKNKDNSNG